MPKKKKHPSVPPPPKGEDLPQTIEAAVAVIIARLDPPYAAEIRALRAENLITLHHDLGMTIRNTFGLWQPDSPLRVACGNVYPDEASMVIIHAVWRYLQEHEDEA